MGATQVPFHSPGNRQSSVDSFRGLAALSVVFAHFQCGIEYAALPSTQLVHENIGSLLTYLFRGTSVYFMVITGFILGMKLPQWKRHPDGLHIRAAQRMTKIIIVFWVALAIIMGINLLRLAIVGKTWVNPSLTVIISQFLFFSNFMDTRQHYIPPAWYIEADFILFLALISCYTIWNKLSVHLQNRWRPFLFLLCIPLFAASLHIQSQNMFGHGIYQVIRLVAYFLLGFLAWHAKTHSTAMFALLMNSVLMLIWNDRTLLHTHLYASSTLVMAFIFFMSHYQTPLNTLTSQPLIVSLYRINFGLFLLNWFVIGVGFSFARHLCPSSLNGLFIILVMTFAVLVYLSIYFRHHIQIPILRWHDAQWNNFLHRSSTKVSIIRHGTMPAVTPIRMGTAGSRSGPQLVQPNGK